MDEKEKQARLDFAKSCLKLARREMKEHGRKFMNNNDDVYDVAMQYGGKIKITREELLEADEK